MSVCLSVCMFVSRTNFRFQKRSWRRRKDGQGISDPIHYVDDVVKRLERERGKPDKFWNSLNWHLGWSMILILAASLFPGLSRSAAGSNDTRSAFSMCVYLILGKKVTKTGQKPISIDENSDRDGPGQERERLCILVWPDCEEESPLCHPLSAV